MLTAQLPDVVTQSEEALFFGNRTTNRDQVFQVATTSMYLSSKPHILTEKGGKHNPNQSNLEIKSIKQRTTGWMSALERPSFVHSGPLRQLTQELILVSPLKIQMVKLKKYGLWIGFSHRTMFFSGWLIVMFCSHHKKCISRCVSNEMRSPIVTNMFEPMEVSSFFCYWPNGSPYTNSLHNPHSDNLS